MEPQHPRRSIDTYRLLAWIEDNRKGLIVGALLAGLIAMAVGYIVWQRGEAELEASRALLELQVRAAEEERPGGEAYLAIANGYPRTNAGQEALLLAGSAFFAEDRFADAQAQFQRFLEDYRGHPLQVQAMLGLAASLDAKDQTRDAMTHYQDVVSRYPDTPAAAQARLSLARLHGQEGQPELALNLYDELIQRNDDWGRQAQENRRQLLAEHPELKPEPELRPEEPATVQQP